MEKWKVIEGVSYEISDLGRVRHYITNHSMIKTPFYRYLKPYIKKSYRGKYKTAYLQVMVHINGREYKVQRLVAHYFIRPLTKNDVVVNIKDITNNRVEHLRVISKSESGRRTGYMSKQRKIVLLENGNIKQVFNSTRDVERKLHISRQTASDYCNKKVKKPMFNLKWADELI